MPRPTYNSQAARESESAEKKGIFKSWAEKRRQARAMAAEEAAKEITNDTAANENKIIDTLQSIDFINSRLPKEVLEAKSNPEQPLGDLELSARAIARTIQKNPQTVEMDIRRIDTKLLTLAGLFKQTVEQGDRRAANAAKAALVRGVKDIRGKVPANQPELAEAFIKVNEAYLESWITLVGIEQAADRLEKNAEEQKSVSEARAAKNQKDIDEFYDMIQNDAEKTLAFKTIMENDTAEDRVSWTQEQRDLHRSLIEHRMNTATMKLAQTLLDQKLMSLSAMENRAETLYAKVASLPIISDPDLMNKFQEQIDLLFQELAEGDQELDETLKAMDDIEGRIAQLDNAPGAVRAREIAAEAAESVVEEIKKKQQVLTRDNADKAKDLRESMGIRSEEEQRAMEEEAARIQQEFIETVAEEEGEVLYN